MKLVKNNKNKKGFTLIELIVVIAIIAILALILIPTISGYIARAEHARDEANARNLYTAAILVAETENVDLNATDAGANVYGKAKAYITVPADVTASVTVTNGEITSVTYNDVTFNGSEFTTPTE
ncbi:hypothetical protein AOC36_04040 [Erysipelothrix larvae]|uniref:Prepilin-type N-terminal cleavage/methylation domain-containing protein n=1 Tax=Erysipelothrix larvae TaxID=1514105 RepID=A0A0X8GZC7_9FIRM|nr:prepilin-type N-terminal cleavage/methylation domain-containing protein [Erysipelothrix larvae]AMC93170.1 hypothetical protein AOC36_04040 [Erysipelothrix larvae]